MRNEIYMDPITRIKIREWERERDRNLRLRCPLTAARYQRYIDRAIKEEGKEKNEDEKGTDRG